MNDQDAIEEASNRSVVGIVLAGLIAMALALFIVQNTGSTPVSWLWIDGSAPLWAVVFGSALAGAVLSEALGWMIRRARRRGR